MSTNQAIETIKGNILDELMAVRLKTFIIVF